jgi:hypothetical protein
MSTTSKEMDPTFAFFMEQGRRLAEIHRSVPVGQDSVESFEIQVTAVGGSRASFRKSGLPLENFTEVRKALDELHELANEHDAILDEEVIVDWLDEIQRAFAEGKYDRKDEKEGVEPSISKVSISEGSEANSWTTAPFKPYEEGDNPYMDEWLSKTFDLDFDAKKKAHYFVGGADEVPNGAISAPCLHCNKPVGPETDQHVVKCKFAHEEQERLYWAMDQGNALRGRSRR